MKTKILVVEDDEHIAVLLRYMLERAGYAVDHLADGRAALEHIVKAPTRPDIVLLDSTLPCIDGIQLLRDMRRRAPWRSVPVIMLSARTLERDVVAALDAGATDYVVKPFQPQELLARLRRATGANRLAAQQALPA